MNLLLFLAQTKLSNESDFVEVSTLPHPISMFAIGALLVLVIFLFLEYNRMRKTISELKIDNDNSILDLKGELIKSFIELKGDIQRNKIEELENIKSFDIKINEISKKVDSRVDKAILAIKKAIIEPPRHHHQQDKR